ncbi:hypothetical protein D3C86_1235210 [compost metagenome]
MLQLGVELGFLGAEDLGDLRLEVPPQPLLGLVEARGELGLEGHAALLGAHVDAGEGLGVEGLDRQQARILRRLDGDRVQGVEGIRKRVEPLARDRIQQVVVQLFVPSGHGRRLEGHPVREAHGRAGGDGDELRALHAVVGELGLEDLGDVRDGLGDHVAIGDGTGLGAGFEDGTPLRGGPPHGVDIAARRRIGAQRVERDAQGGVAVDTAPLGEADFPRAGLGIERGELGAEAAVVVEGKAADRGFLHRQLP